MRIVAGLGNPGERYRRTRHNVGFMVVDELLARSHGRWVDDVSCLVSEEQLGEEDVLLVKPMTFMNRSGDAVTHALRSRGLDASALIVVFDDIALDLGALRIRERGTHGGHNGLRSVIEHLGIDDFVRVRVGIRGGDPPEDLAAYVLSDFDHEEILVVQESVGAAADAVVFALHEGVVAAMNRFNTPRRQGG